MSSGSGSGGGRALVVALFRRSVHPGPIGASGGHVPRLGRVGGEESRHDLREAFEAGALASDAVGGRERRSELDVVVHVVVLVVVERQQQRRDGHDPPRDGIAGDRTPPGDRRSSRRHRRDAPPGRVQPQDEGGAPEHTDGRRTVDGMSVSPRLVQWRIVVVIRPGGRRRSCGEDDQRRFGREQRDDGGTQSRERREHRVRVA